MTGQTKFRPSLTSDEIDHILSICKREGSPLSLRIARSLSLFKAKIDNGITKPSHQSNRNPLEDALGFGEIVASENLKDALASEKESRESLYLRWQNDPTKLTVNELNQVSEHRYMSDLMTVEEEIEYEREVLGM